MTIRYEIIDHTADIGIKAKGVTLEELFTNAAYGMFDLMVLRPKKPDSAGVLHKNITINSVDKEHLLVKWLQELLYLFDRDGIIPLSYKFISLNDTELGSNVEVYKIESETIQLKHQIKAVTHHDIKIKKADGLFEVTVIFDV